MHLRYRTFEAKELVMMSQFLSHFSPPETNASRNVSRIRTQISTRRSIGEMGTLTGKYRLHLLK